MKVSLTTRKRKSNMIRSILKRWKRKRDQQPPPPPQPEAEDDTPINSTACLNNVNDMKRFEESEDCIIPGFDPSDSNTTAQNPNANDDDVRVFAEKGQVASRDLPHPRNACVKYPLNTTPHDHETHCELCFCFTCDSPAPCEYWTEHCQVETILVPFE